LAIGLSYRCEQSFDGIAYPVARERLFHFLFYLPRLLHFLAAAPKMQKGRPPVLAANSNTAAPVVSKGIAKYTSLFFN
jgi:hypothetical protein